MTTTPTGSSSRDPSSGFTTPRDNEASEKLRDTAGKTANLAKTDGGATGEVQAVPARSSISPPSSTMPLGPNVQQAVTDVARTKDPQLIEILKMPRELMKNVVENLTLRDLLSLEIAIGKIKTDTFKPYEGSLQFLRNILKEAMPKGILNDILADHPNWKSGVDNWKNVSLDDKIWLLRVCELSLLYGCLSADDLRAPQYLLPQVKQLCTEDLNRIPELLKEKEKIEKSLANIEVLNLGSTGLTKCPDAICLLPNLQKLYLGQNNLEVPPDVSRNAKLTELYLFKNKLKTPPDVSKNGNLQILELSDNPLKRSPDVTHNINLRMLHLNNNRITSPPDVSKNIHLKLLNLFMNGFEGRLDLTQNVELEFLNIAYNTIRMPFDLSRNVKLILLSMTGCGIDIVPDLSRSRDLKILYIMYNKITTLPDLSPHAKLEKFHIGSNPLNEQAEQQLEKLKKEHPTWFTGIHLD